MAISVDEYRRLKAKVDDQRDKAARAEGAYQEAMKRLADLGHETVEGAEEGLADLKKRAGECEAEYDNELEAFKAKWGDLL